MQFKPAISLFLLATASVALAQDPAFFLKEGDRVVFYGDSITDQRLYTTFTETFALTRFPQLNATFIHSGWGGDRVGGGGGGPIDLRLKRDVLAYKPTVLTIMLGMNDGSYRAFDDKIFGTYTNGFQNILEVMKKEEPNLRLTLIQPSPYDDVTRAPSFEGGYNAVLVRYGTHLKEVAEREKLTVADLNTGVVGALQKANTSNAEVAKKIIQDRVHPGAAGQLLMAAELLKAWKAPAVVTAVELDAAGKKVVRQENTQVASFKVDGTLSWSQLDKALPMPVDLKEPVMALAVSSSDFVERLNQQPLRITGLSGNRYTLKIDTEAVGSFSRGDLEKGINLATLPTPMATQAAKVHELTLKHNTVHFTRWRQVQVPLAGDKTESVQKAVAKLMSALDEEEEGIVKQQRAAAQPVKRKYELVAE